MMIDFCGNVWAVVLVSWLSVLPAIGVLWATHGYLKRVEKLLGGKA